MDVQPTPQEAFHQWLRESLSSALRALRGDSRSFLERAVDHADLERRLRARERLQTSPRFW